MQIVWKLNYLLTMWRLVLFKLIMLILLQATIIKLSLIWIQYMLLQGLNIFIKKQLSLMWEYILNLMDMVLLCSKQGYLKKYLQCSLTEIFYKNLSKLTILTSMRNWLSILTFWIISGIVANCLTKQLEMLFVISYW